MISTDVTLWLQVALIFMFLSQIYKDNFFYRFAEYTFIAIGVGHGAVLAYKNVLSMAITPILAKGQFILAVPILLGFVILSKLSKRYGWVSRWPMAVLIGVSISIAVRGAIRTQIYDQIIATMQLASIKPTALDTMNGLIIVVTTICTISYFVYSREQKGLFGVAGKIARLTMMATFGNGVAWMFMGRLASLIAQMQLILLDWLGLG